MMIWILEYDSPVSVAISFGDFPVRRPRTIAAIIAFVMTRAFLTSGKQYPSPEVHKTISDLFIDGKSKARYDIRNDISRQGVSGG
jgi:hypothetical protein